MRTKGYYVGLIFKIIALVLIVALLGVTVAVMLGYLGSDNKMIDYAKNIKLNTEKYPELKSQGLFWWTWDDAKNMPVKVSASTAEGAKLIDTNKPTVIQVHGWGGGSLYSHLSEEAYIVDGEAILLSNGQAGADYDYMEGRPPFKLNKTLAALGDYDEYKAADGIIYFGKICLELGYNYGTFYYNKFCSASISDAEAEIYFNTNMNFESENGKVETNGVMTTDGDACEYSIGQFFAAEYARAMQLLPETMGDKEIRVGGHSLGGIMTVNGVRIMKALAEDGQIAEKQVPSRVALLDTYLGFASATQKKSEVYDQSIAWSGEKPVDHCGSATYLSYVKYLQESGVAFELYILDGGLVPKLSSDDAVYKLMDYSATVIIDTPMFSSFDKFGAGHNAMYEWYFASFTGRAKIKGTSNYAPSATLPTAALKTYMGKIYKVTTESEYNYDFDTVTVEPVEKNAYL